MSVELSINFAGSKTGSVKIEKFRDELIPNLRRGMKGAGLLIERATKNNLRKGGGGMAGRFLVRFHEATLTDTGEVKKAWVQRGKGFIKSYDPFLRSQTGTLRRSINSQMGNEGGLPSVAVGPNVPYAAIHEFGGKIPVSEKMRRFLHMAGIHLKRSTTFIEMPERAWFFPVVKRQTPKIAETIQEAINKPLG